MTGFDVDRVVLTLCCVASDPSARDTPDIHTSATAIANDTDDLSTELSLRTLIPLDRFRQMSRPMGCDSDLFGSNWPDAIASLRLPQVAQLAIAPRADRSRCRWFRQRRESRPSIAWDALASPRAATRASRARGGRSRGSSVPFRPPRTRASASVTAASNVDVRRDSSTVSMSESNFRRTVLEYRTYIRYPNALRHSLPARSRAHPAVAGGNEPGLARWRPARRGYLDEVLHRHVRTAKLLNSGYGRLSREAAGAPRRSTRRHEPDCVLAHRFRANLGRGVCAKLDRG